MPKLKLAFVAPLLSLVLLLSSQLITITATEAGSKDYNSFNGLKPAATSYVSFPIGAGGSDVVPHQIVRAADDRLYIFVYQSQSSPNLKAYWTPNPGLPTTTTDFAEITPSVVEGSLNGNGKKCR